MSTKRNMVISLIGRPNVGKSSLFNALIRKQHKAITFDTPGVTRDRHYAITTFADTDFDQPMDTILVDTGGFYPRAVDEESGPASERQAAKFFNIMTDQAKLAIAESDLVLLVVDAREGLLPFDHDIATHIRGMKKEFWLLANKYDTEKQAGSEAEFYALGIDEEELFTVSAAHGRGLGFLRERLHKRLIRFDQESSSSEISSLQRGVTPRENVAARVSIIGAPNAGKSTLLNQLLGAERALVSDIAGTTVDPIEGFFDLYFGEEAAELDNDRIFDRDDELLAKNYENFRRNNPELYQAIGDAYIVEADEKETEEMLEYEYEGEEPEIEAIDDSGVFTTTTEEIGAEEIEEEVVAEVTEEKEKVGSFWRSIHLVDTAGIRRKKSLEGFIEEQSVYRSLRSITESDVVIYMVDAEKGVGHQDRRLLDIALDKGKSVIILLNKIDLIRSKTRTEKDRKNWLNDLRAHLPWLDFCEMVPASAMYDQGLGRLKAALRRTILIRSRRIPTGELNRFVFNVVERHPILLKGSKGRRFKVKYASMVKSDPPTFLFFTNKSKGIPDHYRRYLQNGLRGQFGLVNTPVHLIFRTGSDLERRMKKVTS